MSTSTILPVIHPVEGDLHPQSLARVHTSVIDARNGQEALAERAEPDIRPVVEAFRDIHERHARELATCMIRHGQSPDDDGSFMTLVHEGVARAYPFGVVREADVVNDSVGGLFSHRRHLDTPSDASTVRYSR